MAAFPAPLHAPAVLLFPLTVANGVAVSTLYWGQAVVGRAAAEWGPSAAISLMPGATLAGYALGVAALATMATDMTRPLLLGRHFALLAVALCAAALAQQAAVLTAACLCIGAGCALTQRLLAIATSAVAAERRAPTIGWIIAGGLCGIVVARSCVPELAGLLGWRGVFWADAALAGASGLAATVAAARVRGAAAGQKLATLPGAASVWRGRPTLRHAALQQAAVFAAFNMGWAIFPRVVARIGTNPALSMACIALLGAGAALASGRLCGRWGTARVARAGVLAVSAAAPVLALGLTASGSCLLGMVLLDTGTQVALVANQARAQALASTPAMRGRLAAIVTTVGFIGGALGSALGNYLALRGLVAPL